MKLENNLGEDPIGKLVMRLAIPSMFAQFVSVLYSIVDRMFIGNIKEIGEVALAGVGVCGPIVTLLSSFAALIGIGGAPLMSMKMGAKDEKGAEKILANCFLMLLVISGVLMAVAFLLKEQMLWWFGAGERTFSYANEYITIYLMGTVFAILTVGMNQFIICQGFAKVGMISVLIGAVCNIILDPICIFVFHMGVKGGAFATILSQMASCIFVLQFLFSKKVPIRITFGGYHKNIMKRVLTLGFTPFIIIAFDNILIISLNAILQKYGGVKGDMLLTCGTIVQSFMLLVTMPLGGITGGTQAILAYNYGAGNTERIKKAEKYIAAYALVFTGILFLAAQIIPEYFVKIFTQNETYISLTVWAIRVYTLGIIPLALQYTIVDGFTGMGIANLAISLSFFRKGLYFLGIFLIPVFFPIENVFFTEPITDIISAMVSTIIYFSFIGKILRKRNITGM
ncbi:MAG: MATE family efflux transporter [Lachnospiraceae bacterium]|jgi:putative MATE family efflux protein|nr:MATE family efflux transporter [Lachnospiraceae bacterium]